MYWPRLITALVIAAHVWGPAPCGTPVVKFEPLAYNVGADADPVNCLIEVNQWDRMWYSEHPAQRCSTIVHEWGHLVGRPHSSDRLDAMWEGRHSLVWKECVRGPERRRLAATHQLAIHADRSAFYPAWPAVLAALQAKV